MKKTVVLLLFVLLTNLSLNAQVTPVKVELGGFLGVPMEWRLKVGVGAYSCKLLSK